MAILFPTTTAQETKSYLPGARQRCWKKTIIIHYFTSPLLPATVTHDECLVMHVLLVPLHNQSLVGCILTPLPLPPKCLLTAEVGFIFQKLRKAVVGEERTCWPAICHVVSWRGMWGSSLFRMNEKGYLGEITEKNWQQQTCFNHSLPELSLHVLLCLLLLHGGPVASSAFVEKWTSDRFN